MVYELEKMTCGHPEKWAVQSRHSTFEGAVAASGRCAEEFRPSGATVAGRIKFWCTRDWEFGIHERGMLRYE